METIWITGGKGFIGRYLSRYLKSQNLAVFGLGHGLWSEEEYRKWGYTAWINGEIEEVNFSQLFEISGLPQTIYHLAGGSSVGLSLQSPLEDFRRTVESSSRLLDWVRMNSVETRIIAISSAAVYGAKYKGPISEDSRLSPYSPYGVHKAMMEDLCRSYSENFGLNTAIVRLFSVYGAGLEKQLIWDLCSKLLASKDNNIVLGGTGNELRDWLHVEDAIRLLTLVGKQAGTSCPVFNGGTGIATSIRSIAEIVCQAWGGDHRIEFNGVARKGDPESLVADVFKYQILDFIPKINIQEGLSGVVAWFKSRASV